MSEQDIENAAEKLQDEPDMKIVYGRKLAEVSEQSAWNALYQTEFKGDLSSELRDLGFTFFKDPWDLSFITHTSKGKDGFRVLLPASTSVEDVPESLLNDGDFKVIESTIPSSNGIVERESIEFEKVKDGVELQSFLLQKQLDAASDRGDVVLFGMKSDDTGMLHSYVALNKMVHGPRNESGIHAVEGHAGGTNSPDTWDFYKGRIKRLSDGSLFIPMSVVVENLHSIQLLHKIEPRPIMHTFETQAMLNSSSN